MSNATMTEHPQLVSLLDLTPEQKKQLAKKKFKTYSILDKTSHFCIAVENADRIVETNANAKKSVETLANQNWPARIFEWKDNTVQETGFYKENVTGFEFASYYESLDNKEGKEKITINLVLHRRVTPIYARDFEEIERSSQEHLEDPEKFISENPLNLDTYFLIETEGE